MKLIQYIITISLFLNPFFALVGNKVSAQEVVEDVNQTTDVDEPTFTEPDENYEKKFQGEPAKGEAWDKPPLKVSGADMQAIQDGKVDVRVLKYLNWLTTMKEDGGANHHHIKVTRIVKNYKGKKSQSKETDYEDVALNEEPEEVTQSAHREEDAMAVDFSEIDTYRCTIKKPGGKTKKTPPKPIQIVWQDKAPGETLGDPVGGFHGGNYFDAAEAFYSAGFLTGVIDDMESNIEEFRLNDNSLPGMVLGMGIANFNEDLGAEYSATGDLKTTSQQLGQNILSQQTGMPSETFSGEDKDQWLANIVLGQAEKDIDLLPGSLTGGNTDTDGLIIQTGMRAVEEELTLRPQILNSTSQDGLLGLSQSKIESIFELPTGSFIGSKQDVEKEAGASLSDIIGSLVRADERLGLSNGTTEKMIKGEISLTEYTQRVAVQMKSQYIDRYDEQYGKVDLGAIFGTSGIFLNQIEPPQIDPRKNSEYVWDIPQGTIELLLKGQMKKFYRAVGMWRLGKAMGLPQDEIDNLVLKAQIKEINSFSASRSHTKPAIMTSQDWLILFKDDQNAKKEVFDRLGEEIYYRNIKPKVKTNLYLDFRKKSLDELFEGSGKINEFTQTMGAKLLESNFDIEENSIVKLLNDNNPNYLRGFSRNDLSKIGDELNANSGLNFRYKNADNYKFTGEDARALLQGRIAPVAAKWGGYDFDGSIHALSGNSQDYLKGAMSSQRLFANAGLLEMARVGGYNPNDKSLQEPAMSNGSDPRVGILAKYIDDNGNIYTAERLNNWFDVEDYPGYDFNTKDVAKQLQDPKTNSGALYASLSNLMAENIAAKGGLDSKAITDVLTNPQNAATIMQDEGMSMLSKITGLGSDKIPAVYKNHDDYVYIDSSPLASSMATGIEKMSSTIALSLGIGSNSDASEFLNGYVEKGLKSWSTAMFTKEVNEDLQKAEAMVDYSTLAKSVFGDPTKEKQAADSAAGKTGGANANISPEVVTNEAVMGVMNDLKQEANYKVLDAELIKKDPNIPVGFSQTMIIGTDEQRMELLGDYALANAGISDQTFSEMIGIELPSGSVTELTQFAQSKISYDQIVDNFEKYELSEETLFSWGDTALGFESGTTSQLYGTYQDFQGLEAAYTAGEISAAEYQANEIALAVTTVDTLTGGALTEATSPIDDALGMPAGTTLQLGIAIATSNYAQAAMIVAGAIFGWGDVKCPDLKKLAQEKVREVLTQTMEFAQEELKTNHEDMIVPSQILTWRKEDIEAMLPYTEKIYGEGGYLGKAGFIQSLNPKEIHVGF